MSFELPIDNKFIYKFFADSETIRGVVIISHGMAEHIIRYGWLIKQLNASGYHVVCADHLGHGKYINDGATPGYFSDSNDFEDVENNLIHILNYVSYKFPDLKNIDWTQYGFMDSYGGYTEISKYRCISINWLILNSKKNSFGSTKACSIFIIFLWKEIL